VHSSYSRQRSAAASGVSVFGLEDDAGRAGGVEIVDHWTIGPRAMLDVGGRYERYDYLRDPGLFSPTIHGVAVASGTDGSASPDPRDERARGRS
jgi:hypothetical protein